MVKICGQGNDFFTVSIILPEIGCAPLGLDTKAFPCDLPRFINSLSPVADNYKVAFFAFFQKREQTLEPSGIEILSFVHEDHIVDWFYVPRLNFIQKSHREIFVTFVLFIRDFPETFCQSMEIYRFDSRVIFKSVL